MSKKEKWLWKSNTGNVYIHCDDIIEFALGAIVIVALILLVIFPNEIVKLAIGLSK
jgi:hypothetical protein